MGLIHVLKGSSGCSVDTKLYKLGDKDGDKETHQRPWQSSDER